MPRAAQRSPSTDAVFRDGASIETARIETACIEAACIETAELLDRTGIIAASLPKRRRSPENVPPPLPVRTPVCEPVVDQDLRPKAVVIHRRARSWLVGGAGVALLAIGWLAGTLTLPAPVDDALPEQPLPAVVTQQAAPQAPAAQPAPQAAPVTVFVPVTVKQQAPAPKKKTAKEQVVALPPAQTRPPEQPRSDLGLTTRPPEAIAEDFEDMMNSSMAGSMAMEMAQGMVVYSSGR